jgi:hypothetical protein
MAEGGDESNQHSETKAVLEHPSEEEKRANGP